MTRISINDVKEALKDPEFRKKLPKELAQDISKYEQNPGCTCNLSVYKNVLRYGKKQLIERFPNAEIPNPDTEIIKLQENNWSVINCHIDELEGKLKQLAMGRKQIAIARYEDQVTAIVNELSF